MGLTNPFSAKKIMTELELLEDTIGYYSEDINRRCVSDAGGCKYSPLQTGKVGISDGCAIGRFMTPEAKEAAWGAVGTVYNTNINLLPDFMQEMDVKFLGAVQSLHDDPDCWEEGGLTERGQEYVNSIKRTFKL